MVENKLLFSKVTLVENNGYRSALSLGQLLPLLRLILCPENLLATGTGTAKMVNSAALSCGRGGGGGKGCFQDDLIGC